MSKDKRETARMIVRLGTTHAHAGQTVFFRFGLRLVRNHPCTRGTDHMPAVGTYSVTEPPMHTRGRPGCYQSPNDNNGTTHAHAGQTRL